MRAHRSPLGPQSGAELSTLIMNGLDPPTAGLVRDSTTVALPAHVMLLAQNAWRACCGSARMSTRGAQGRRAGRAYTSRSLRYPRAGRAPRSGPGIGPAVKLSPDFPWLRTTVWDDRDAFKTVLNGSYRTLVHYYRVPSRSIGSIGRHGVMVLRPEVRFRPFGRPWAPCRVGGQSWV